VQSVQRREVEFWRAVVLMNEERVVSPLMMDCEKKSEEEADVVKKSQLGFLCRDLFE